VCYLTYSAYGRHGIFAKNDALAINCAVVTFLKARTTSPNRELSATMVWPCNQDVPKKLGEVSPVGYNTRKLTRS